MISEDLRPEMNTNDAKEYLARREIPQLFEVRAAARFQATSWVRAQSSVLDALQHARRSHGNEPSVFMLSDGGWR